MNMKAFTLFALTLLGVASALPANVTLPELDGFSEFDAIPADGGLVSRTHQGTIVGKDLIASCPGGPGSPNVERADRCTLIKIVNNPDKRIWTVLGDAQLNCKGSQGDIRVTLGGSTTVTRTTTVEVTFGIESEGLSIGGGISESLEKATTQSQLTLFSIPPGRQAVYVAGVNHKVQTGNVQVNYPDRQKGHYVWYTGARITMSYPDPNNVEYDVYESKCGTNPMDLSKYNR